MIVSGKVNLLQKASKTSNKIIYNGNEPVGIEGTDGKTGDYYIYTNKILQLLDKKNIQTIISKTLKDCTNVKTDNTNLDNISKVIELITQFNNCK